MKFSITTLFVLFVFNIQAQEEIQETLFKFKIQSVKRNNIDITSEYIGKKDIMLLYRANYKVKFGIKSNTEFVMYGSINDYMTTFEEQTPQHCKRSNNTFDWKYTDSSTQGVTLVKLQLIFRPKPQTKTFVCEYVIGSSTYQYMGEIIYPQFNE